MSENYLNVSTFQMNRRIYGLLCKPLVDEVEKTVLGLVFHAVENQRETPLEIGVVLHHCLYVVHIVFVGPVELGVRHE